MFPDLKKMKTPELIAALEVYRTNPTKDANGQVVTVAGDDILTNNALRIEELTRLRSVAGYPKTITQEDLDQNPLLVSDGIVVDEVVFLSQAEVDEETKKEAAVSLAAQNKPEETNPNLPHGPAPEPVVPASDDLVYKGKAVIRTSNKLVHGKRYVEVDVASEAYTLTVEEFERDVHPRHA